MSSTGRSDLILLGEEWMRLGVRLRIVNDPKNEPPHCSEHAQPADAPREMADFLIVIEDAPLGEENGPITFVGVDERKRERTGVCHIRANIKEIFEEPENGEGKAVGLAMIEKEGGTKSRDNQFAKSAAEDHKRVTKPAEEGVAGFVNDQVGVIEEEEAGGVAPGVQQEENVERDDDGAAEAGDASPVVGAVHEESVAVERRLKKGT